MDRFIWHDAQGTVDYYPPGADTPILLQSGDHVAMEVGNRQYERVKINFIGRLTELGPRGFTYLPWRGDRWATPVVTLRGDVRFAICFPSGAPHYGRHMTPGTLQLLTPLPHTPE
jgi:hypothetical protein